MTPTKSTEQYFADWYKHNFAYGYGTGEPHILQALRIFLDHCIHGEGSLYHSQDLEEVLGPTAAWLIIDRLCAADIIEYGTSPRNGWLTCDKGEKLKEVFYCYNNNQLFNLLDHDENYYHCTPNHCNCDAVFDAKGLPTKQNNRCINPFWTTSRYGSLNHLTAAAARNRR